MVTSAASVVQEREQWAIDLLPWELQQCLGQELGVADTAPFLRFVLCFSAEPEAAGRGASRGAWAREGHWLCCSDLHGPAGPDHPRRGPGAAGECCWQCCHRDFSIHRGADRLLLCGFLRSLRGLGLQEEKQLEEISPGERFLSVFFTSSTGAVAVLTLLGHHPLLPPWIGCNSRALWNGDLIKLVASDAHPHTPPQCSHAVTCDALCGHGILMDQESLWNSSLPICGS